MQNLYSFRNYRQNTVRYEPASGSKPFFNFLTNFFAKIACLGFKICAKAGGTAWGWSRGSKILHFETILKKPGFQTKISQYHHLRSFKNLCTIYTTHFDGSYCLRFTHCGGLNLKIDDSSIFQCATVVNRPEMTPKMEFS